MQKNHKCHTIVKICHEKTIAFLRCFCDGRDRNQVLTMYRESFQWRVLLPKLRMMQTLLSKTLVLLTQIKDYTTVTTAILPLSLRQLLFGIVYVTAPVINLYTTDPFCISLCWCCTMQLCLLNIAIWSRCQWHQI